MACSTSALGIGAPRPYSEQLGGEFGMQRKHVFALRFASTNGERHRLEVDIAPANSSELASTDICPEGERVGELSSMRLCHVEQTLDLVFGEFSARVAVNVRPSTAKPAIVAIIFFIVFPLVGFLLWFA